MKKLCLFAVFAASLHAQATLMSGSRVVEGALNYTPESGTGNSYVTSNPTSAKLNAYILGYQLNFKATHTNTGPATIAIDNLATKNLVKQGTTPLAAGDIVSGAIVTAVFDGTAFQVLNVAASGVSSITLSGDISGSGTSSIAATLASVNTNTGSFGSASQVPALTLDAKGRITAAANTPIAISASQVTSGTMSAVRLPIANDVNF